MAVVNLLHKWKTFFRFSKKLLRYKNTSNQKSNLKTIKGLKKENPAEKHEIMYLNNELYSTSQVKETQASAKPADPIKRYNLLSPQ
jgi:hypothetical protein